MFEQQKQDLEKLRGKLSVLRTLNDAFQAALDDPALEPHTCTALKQWRRPLVDRINELDAQAANLLRVIGDK